MTAQRFDSCYSNASGCRPSNRPCAGSSEHCHSVLPSPRRSSPSTPQPLWVLPTGLIFTCFTCEQLLQNQIPHMILQSEEIDWSCQVSWRMYRAGIVNLVTLITARSDVKKYELVKIPWHIPQKEVGDASKADTRWRSKTVWVCHFHGQESSPDCHHHAELLVQ